MNKIKINHNVTYPSPEFMLVLVSFLPSATASIPRSASECRAIKAAWSWAASIVAPAPCFICEGLRGIDTKQTCSNLLP